MCALMPKLQVIGMEADGPEHIADLEALVSSIGPAAAEETEPSALAAVYYTGGTTGFPKGVMLSRLALWVNAIGVSLASNLTSEDRILHAAPDNFLSTGEVPAPGQSQDTLGRPALCGGRGKGRR